MGTLIHSSRSAASPPAHRREKSQGRGKNGRSGPSRPYNPHELSLTSSALTIAFPAAYFTGAVFPPKIVLLLYPRYAPPPPAGDSPQGKALMGETEKDLQKLWIVARLRTREGWYETRKSVAFPSSGFSMRQEVSAGPEGESTVLWASEAERGALRGAAERRRGAMGAGESALISRTVRPFRPRQDPQLPHSRIIARTRKARCPAYRLLKG